VGQQARMTGTNQPLATAPAARQRRPGRPPGRPARRARVVVAALVLVSLPVLGGCTPAAGGGNGADEPPDAGRWRETVELVCQAADQAERDPAAAGVVFRDRAHDRLHELAQAVDFSSRAAAGRLLEAKAVVEGDLERRADGPRLATDLRDLVTAGREALVALSVTPPRCAG